jgi:hypothetical protein
VSLRIRKHAISVRAADAVFPLNRSLAENFVTSGAESLRTSFMLAVVAGLVALKVLL